MSPTTTRWGALLGVRSEAGEPDSQSLSSGTQYQPLIAAGVASLGIALLMGGQFLFTPETLVFEETENVQVADAELEEQEPEAEELSFSPTTEEPEEETTAEVSEETEADKEQANRIIKLNELPTPIDVSEYPLLGNPDAPHVFVDMLDYTCSHCRTLHQFTKKTLERYDGQIAFVIYHVPLSKKCNPHVKKDFPGKGECLRLCPTGDEHCQAGA